MRRTTITLLALLCLLPAMAGCGGASGKTDEFNIKITGTRSEPADVTAARGDTVKLTLTADKDIEVHLHGYDIHFELKAGTPLTKTFTADKTGEFEYEIEASTTHLGSLKVTP